MYDVTFLLSSLRLSGGVSLVLELAHGLLARGHSVRLVYPRSPVDDFLFSAISPEIQRYSVAPLVPGPGLGYLILTMARAVPPNTVVVATHTPTTIPGWLACRISKKGPLVWLYMDYPVMFQGRPLEAWLLEHMPSRVDAVAAISRPLVEQAQTRTSGNVYFVGSGIPTELIRYAGAHGQKEEEERGISRKIRILYIGDSRPRKGLQDFLSAMGVVWATYPEACAVIVSKERLDLSFVPGQYEFHYRPDNEKLASLYHSATMFVSTSWGEGLGYPPLEAMAFGLPVVVTDSYGVRDYARDGENCLLVPAARPEKIAAAILRLLSEPALRERLRMGGAHTVSNYRWDKMVERFEAMLQILYGS